MSTRVAIDLRCLQDAAPTGVATYTRATIDALIKQPSNLKFLGITSGWKQPLENILPSQLIERRHLRFPNRLANAFLTISEKPWSQTWQQDIDVVWQPNPMFVPALKVPHFVTIHDLSFIHFPEFFPKHTRLWYNRWVENWLRRAPSNAHLIAVSPHTATDIEQTLPQWRGRVSIVPPPLLLNTVPINKDIRLKFKLRRPYILGVGTIEPRKNISGLVAGYRQFLKQHGDFDLVLVGRGKVKAIDLNDRVHVLGYLTDADREALYANAFCFVYPSYYEGYGYPPLEAMRYGIPVISSNTTSLPWLLGNAALYIDPYNAAEEIAAALTAVAQDSELRARLAEAGLLRLKTLQNNFTVQPLIDLWQKSVLA